MVKKALICHSAERVPEFVDIAFREAVSGRPGPVYLELPVDVLGAEPRREVELPVTRAESGVVDRDKARELLAWIAESEKPMLIAGSGAWYSDAGEELTRFIEATGVPMFTAANGRGVVPDTHPLCFEGSLAIRPGSGIHAGMNTGFHTPTPRSSCSRASACCSSPATAPWASISWSSSGPSPRASRSSS